MTQFRERISALIEELSAASDLLGIPTPALAETLVRSGPNRSQYLKVLGDSWKFQLLPFDARAAIESAELIAAVKNRKDPWDAWAKVKFDIQIVATAKAENASVIYSDDRDIENYARRFNIKVIRICDLPLPSLPLAPAAAATGSLEPQMPLPLSPPSITQEPSIRPQPQEPPDEKRDPNEPKPGEAAGTEASDL